MRKAMTELKQRLAEAADLSKIGALLYWDQSIYMPAGGADARGRHMARIDRLAHERATAPAIGRLLDKLQPYAESLPADHDDAALVHVARRNFERKTKVPPAFVAELSSHGAASYQAWTAARPANDFAQMQPYLEKTVELSRRYAEFFAPYDHIADPLIADADHGMTAATVSAAFADLRRALVPLVKAITAQPPADDACLRQTFPGQGQWDFGLIVARQIGYDFERGRLDRAPHPYTIEFGIGDVRITTRVDERNLGDSIFSTIHEAGHAMYEQGVRADYEGTPLAGGTSAGVHESQSRLWENIVGRSRAFWSFYYGQLQTAFPDQLNAVSLDAFYRAINKVQPSLIRTDADEVTYNLHVMLRFDLELALLEGRLAVKDLPAAWNAAYQADLGITPPDHKDGVLQDVHWFNGYVGGAFQGYTLGNIMSGQFYAAALAAHPQIETEISQGRFDTLLGWLRENIYQHGSKYTASELLARVTGGPLRSVPYMDYLRTKYGALYGV